MLYRKECGWCSPSDRRVRVPNAFTFRYSVVQRVTFSGGHAYSPWTSQPVAPSPNAPPVAHTPRTAGYGSHSYPITLGCDKIHREQRDLPPQPVEARGTTLTAAPWGADARPC